MKEKQFVFKHNFSGLILIICSEKIIIFNKKTASKLNHKFQKQK